MSFRNFVITLGLFAGAGLLGACASQPATTAAAAPAAAVAPAPAATPAPAAATAEAVTAASLEKKFRDAARGYKVVERDGKTLYCKREKVMGSTIPTLQCMTEAQLRTQVENAEELKQRMRGHVGNCGGACAGGG
jgi:hypothetical protein